MTLLLDMARSWESGVLPLGVRFAREAHVRMLDGPFADECASVRDLLDLEPEPRYRVEVDGAHVSLDVSQSSLSAP